MANIFQPGGLLGPLAPGMSGAVNPLAFIGAGMATGDMGAQLARMGQLQQRAAELRFQQEQQQQRMEAMRQEAAAEQQALAIEQARQQRLVALAPRMFPNNPVMQEVAAADPTIIDQLYLKQLGTPIQGTTEMRNIAAAGFEPGQPGYQQAMRKRLGLEETPAKTEFKDVTALRKEYTKESDVWRETRDAYEKMAASEASGPGDINLLTGYMKMLDPGSVVRGEEFANAENAGGVPEFIRNLYNKAITGARLSPELRQSFMSQAAALLDQQRAIQTRREEAYIGIAARNKMPKADAIPDFLGDYRQEDWRLLGGKTGTDSPSLDTADVPAETSDEVRRLMDKYLP